MALVVTISFLTPDTRENQVSYGKLGSRSARQEKDTEELASESVGRNLALKCKAEILEGSN